MDPAELRACFPVLERIAYLNAGSDGPFPSAAAAAGRAALDAAEREGRAGAHVEARKAGHDALRSAYAERLGCDVGDLALTTSSSEGLGKVLAGLGVGAGDEILVAEREHPGLLGPVLAARERGARVRTGPLEALADHVTATTTLVCCSHVGWMSGRLADPRLARTGVPLVLDGAQGVGAVPVDVGALGCLAYAGSGQKWLCGADGTGMLYVSPAARERVTATAPAYGSFDDAGAGLDADLHEDARRHDTPSLPREGVAASVAAAGLLAGFGWDAVHERAATLAHELARELEERGHTVAPRGRTTLVAWEDPDPPATCARLADRGIFVRFLPATPYLRASVGAWNDESDLERLVEAL